MKLDQSDNLNNEINPFVNSNDKGGDSIVVQLGSHSIKFGFASQHHPFMIPNVIAYHFPNEAPNNNSNHIQIPDNLPESFTSDWESLWSEIKTKQSKSKSTLNHLMKTQKNQNETTNILERINEQVPNSTASYKKMEMISADWNEDIINNNFKWINLSSSPSYLVGREALCIPNTSNNYEIHYPIKYGYFNNDYSIHSVISDLHKILNFCFENVLRVPPSEYSNYNIVLLLPDIFIRIQVKIWVNLFLKIFGFKNIFLHLESVMTTFGLAVPSACIVDIGSDKINICCVDEGIIWDETIVRKNFGGNDITLMLYMILKHSATSTEEKNRIYFPWNLFNMSNVLDFRIIEKLKESECECPSFEPNGTIGQFCSKNTNLWYHRKGVETKVINITLHEQAYLPVWCLFSPDILKSFNSINKSVPTLNYYNDLKGDYYTDPEDLMGELWKTFAVEDKKEEKDNKKGGNIGDINNMNIININIDEDSLSQTPSKSDEQQNSMNDEKRDNNCNNNTYESMFDLSAGLDDLICKSWMNISDPDLRKKLSNSIIITGGSTKFKGFIDFLEERWITKLAIWDNEIERVEIYNYPDIDLKTLTWIGGTIWPKLETAKDMWIQRERWCGEPERIDVVVEEKDKEKEEDKDKDKEKLKDELNDSNNNINKDDKDKDKDKKKKIERHLDGGVKLIREKCPFAW